MSNRREREAEDAYEAANDPSPVSGDVYDDSYTQETPAGKRAGIPVQRDEDPYEDPMQPPYSNTDEQLAQDEREAIDQSNILRGGRLRHAKPRTRNQYNEGPDEEDLPADVREGNLGQSDIRRAS